MKSFEYVTVVQYQELKTSLLREILSAETEIFCELSGLTDTEIVNTLSEKAKEGVSIKMRLDGKKFKDGEIMVPNSVKQEDVLVASDTRIHSKYIVIDRKTVLLFTSSLQEKFNDQQPYDAIIKLNSSCAAEILYQENLSQQDIEELKQHSILVRDPFSKKDSLTDALVKAVSQADSIDFFTKDIREHSFFTLLREKAKDIKVAIFASPKFKNDNVINFGTIQIKVQKETSERMHANIAYIDDRVYVGTAYLKERCVGDINFVRASKEIGVWIDVNDKANQVVRQKIINMF
jgi:hypothetical protein